MLPNYKIQPVDAKTEKKFMQQWHYSRKTVPNSVIRLGCYDGAQLVGIASFGRIINCLQLFDNVSNRCGLELNRLAMIDSAPKNSESWFLMRSIKILQHNYPWLKFIHTWADGLRCQGGTIYKACGFLFLRKIPVSGLYVLPNGSIMHQVAFRVYRQKYENKVKHIKGSLEKVQAIFGQGVKPLVGGYQYQYNYLIDKTLKSHLTLKPMPYEAKSAPPTK